MDRTSELFGLISERSSRAGTTPSSSFCHIAPSPFVLRAGQLLRQIRSFEKLLHGISDALVGYHRFYPAGSAEKSMSMTEKERVEFNQEVAHFITTFASEVNQLRKNTGIAGSHCTEANVKFRQDISLLLMERLGAFTKRSQYLQRQRAKYNRSPFFLLTGGTKSEFSAAALRSSRENDENKQSRSGGRGLLHEENAAISLSLNNNDNKKTDNVPTTAPHTISATTSTASTAGTGINQLPTSTKGEGGGKSSRDTNQPASLLPQSFVDRYESEVAPPAKYKEYQAIASKHKSILLKESKILQVQYSEDLREAHKMETTVTQISSYLSEFVQILHSQRDAVDDIHSASKVATQHVKQTDTELTTTIERTESHQRSIIILIVGLSLMLLLLDFITP